MGESEMEKQVRLLEREIESLKDELRHVQGQKNRLEAELHRSQYLPGCLDSSLWLKHLDD